jgi:uncharacterized repeat protein (TIGR03803 family)
MDGDLYGTTQSGGGQQAGAVFKITLSGKLTTLYSFCAQANCTDGEQPIADLVQGTDGMFYGTTLQGGANSSGTVFGITPSGVFTTLHSFSGADGESPASALLEGPDGLLYGTTQGGGATGNGGTIFRMTRSGELTTLYSFCAQTNCTDGDNPRGVPVWGTDGNIYGTTEFGGATSTGPGNRAPMVQNSVNGCYGDGHNRGRTKQNPRH